MNQSEADPLTVNGQEQLSQQLTRTADENGKHDVGTNTTPTVETNGRCLRTPSVSHNDGKRFEFIDLLLMHTRVIQFF